jgi:DNA-directed RNA polymerase subunit alpha
MSDINVHLPSKPKIIREEGFSGVYEIDGLYPGYGHTLGNSLRRIILSSLPGAAIVSVKIAGVSHEFSTIDGVKEDVITILLNLKKLHIKMLSSEPQTLTIKVKGVKDVTAKDIVVPGQVEVLNPELHIASVTDKATEFAVEIFVERGLGFVSREVHQKERVDIGTIALDAIFSPIRRVSYEVENMRVGDRTDYNRLRISIDTNGTISPKEALEKSIEIMIHQLKAVVGFKEEEVVSAPAPLEAHAGSEPKKELDNEFLKTRIETLGLSQRTANALNNANIRTVGGLARKKEADLENIEGLGPKGIQEIKKIMSEYDITLR